MENSCKHIRCGACGGIKLKKAFVGTTLNKVCSGKCLAAQKGSCKCKCLGKFHKGKNSRLLKSIINPKNKIVKKVKKVVEKVKKVVKKVKTKTPFFEPQNIKDEVALFIQGKRFLTKSFDRYSDKNYRRDQKTLALNWLSQKGQSIDVAALDFINLSGYTIDESDVINLIVEIIVDYPSGIKSYIKDALYFKDLKEEEEAEFMKGGYWSNTDYNNLELQEKVRLANEEYRKNYIEPVLIFGTKDMKLKKGSAAAKAFMAKIRAKKETVKKLGAYKKPTIFKPTLAAKKLVKQSLTKKLSKAKEARLNYLQNKEDNDNLTTLQEKEYTKLVLEYKKTDKYKNAQKKIFGWKKGSTRIIEKDEKPFKNLKNVRVKRRIITKPKGSFKSFTNIIGGLFDLKDINNLDSLKQEYRKLANKYHPDKGGTTAQFQELQNEYEKLRNKILSGSSLSEAEKENEIVIDDSLRAAVNSIITLEGINIELIGKWIWVSGNTYPVRTVFSGAGFKFIKKNNISYWVYKGVESLSRGGADMKDIVKKYGSTPIKPTKFSDKKLSGVNITISATQKSKLKTALNKLVKGINKRPL